MRSLMPSTTASSAAWLIETPIKVATAKVRMVLFTVISLLITGLILSIITISLMHF
jgi:hypothetical protein